MGEIIHKDKLGEISIISPSTINIKQKTISDSQVEYDMSVTVNLNNGSIVGTDMSRLLFARNYVLPLIVVEHEKRGRNFDEYTVLIEQIDSAVVVLNEIKHIMKFNNTLNEVLRRKEDFSMKKLKDMYVNMYQGISEVMTKTEKGDE